MEKEICDVLLNEFERVKEMSETVQEMIKDVEKVKGSFEEEMQRNENYIEIQFSKFENLILKPIKNFLGLWKKRMKDNLRRNNSTIFNSLEDYLVEGKTKIQKIGELETVIDEIKLKMKANEEIGQKIGNFDNFHIDNFRTNCIAIQISILKNRNKWESDLKSKLSGVFFDKYKTVFKQTSSSYYQSKIEKLAFKWNEELNETLERFQETDLKKSSLVLDRKLVNYHRTRIDCMNAKDFKELYSQVKMVMGKVIQIDKINLRFQSTLSLNPASSKYLQALMKSIPLTVVVKELDMNLGNNFIDENKLVDLGYLLKHYHYLDKLVLNFKGNSIGTSSLKLLIMGLGYLKDLVELEIDFYNNRVTDEGLRMFLRNINKKQKLKKLKILAENNCFSVHCFGGIIQFLRENKSLEYCELKINNEILLKGGLNFGTKLIEFKNTLRDIFSTKENLRFFVVTLNENDFIYLHR